MVADFEDALKIVTPSEGEIRRLAKCRDSLIRCIDSIFLGDLNYQEFKVIGSAATGNFLRGYKDIDGVILLKCIDFIDIAKRFSRIESLENLVFKEEGRIVSAKANFQFKGYDISIGCIEKNSTSQQSLAMDMFRHPDFTISNLKPSQRGDVLLTKQLFRNTGLYGKKIGGFACEQLIMFYGSFSNVLREFVEGSRIFVDFSGHYLDDGAPIVISYPFSGLDNLTRNVSPQDIDFVRNYSREIIQRPKKFLEDALATINYKFWSDRVRNFGGKEDFSIPDVYLNRMENRFLRRRISQYGGLKVLDLGCANGFTTLAVNRPGNNQIFALDFNIDALKHATNLATKKGYLDIHFISADMANIPFKPEYFDVVYAKRSLINLHSRILQARAVNEIARVLKQGGKFFLFDLFKEGYEKINQRRARLGLIKIDIPYHTTLLSEESLEQMTRGKFLPSYVEDPTSTYYFLSRIIYPFIMQRFNGDILSNSIWNKIAANLPSFGGLGINKFYTFIRT